MNIGQFLRRNAVAIVLLASFSGCTSALLVPMFQYAALTARRSICQSNLKLIALACQQYRADYDGRYPPISDGGPRGWSLLIQTNKKPLQFSCPAGYKSSFSPSSDYFFNARIATRKGTSIQAPDLTIAFGDGIDNGPTNSHFWELPNDVENEDSVTRRHLRGANYAFADGHVKFLKPQSRREGGEAYFNFSPAK
jgi:prepilin-type processing-associated H-X9-DG protein